MLKETQTAQGKAIVTGSVAEDTIIDLPGYFREHAKPDSTHFFALSLLVEKLKVSFGGTATNMAYTEALLGLKPVLLASIGTDRMRELRKLRDVGVNTRYVHRSRDYTSRFFVITDKEHSQIAAFNIGAMSDSSSLSVRRWRDRDAMLLMAAHDPAQMAKQVGECREYNVRLAFAIGQQVNNVPVELLEAGVSQAEVMILNDNEMQDVAKKLHTTPEELALRVPISVTTLGKKGSVIRGSAVDGAIEVPIAKPLRVEDPTGCGDAFAAGFLRGYLGGIDLETSGKIGALAATYVLEQHGTIQHYYSLEEFKQRYRETFSTGVELNEIVPAVTNRENV
jgi:adenosine kinase